MKFYDKPLYTTTYFGNEHDFISGKSIYLYNTNSDYRSNIDNIKEKNNGICEFFSVNYNDNNSVSLKNNFDTFNMNLRNIKSIMEFFQKYKDFDIYLDITGIDCIAWAPIMKVLIEDNFSLHIIYTQPQAYQKSSFPQGGEVYDLRDHIRGIEPLPLFSSLEYDEKDFLFIPLLGFEGVRFAHMLNDLEPEYDNVIPVIGSPGYLPQYPFETFWENSFSLMKINARDRIVFVKSDCPISLYYCLENIRKMYPDNYIKLGLIGTKPHAAGAILFQMTHDNTEIVYDHAIRRKSVSSGISNRLVFHVQEFWKELYL